MNLTAQGNENIILHEPKNFFLPIINLLISV